MHIYILYVYEGRVWDERGMLGLGGERVSDRTGIFTERTPPVEQLHQ